jgi:hypothetical protein
VLKLRIARLDDCRMLNDCSVDDATLHFHAICEGLAGLELRGTMASDAGERLWRQGLSAVVCGLSGPAGLGEGFEVSATQIAVAGGVADQETDKDSSR